MNRTLGEAAPARAAATSRVAAASRWAMAMAPGPVAWMASPMKLRPGCPSTALVGYGNGDPEMIILGGGITGAGGLLFEPLEKFMSKYEWRAGGRKVNIVKAAFGDLSGAIGAAGFAMMQQDQSKQKI